MPASANSGCASPAASTSASVGSAVGSSAAGGESPGEAVASCVAPASAVSRGASSELQAAASRATDRTRTQVQELRLGGVFEGYYDAFVGVREQAAFRVFRLDDPQRVVVDVQH